LMFRGGNSSSSSSSQRSAFSIQLSAIMLLLETAKLSSMVPRTSPPRLLAAQCAQPVHQTLLPAEQVVQADVLPV